MSDEVIVMRRGRIVEAGPTDQVLDQPQHPYTQALLSAVPRPGWKPRRSIRVEEEDGEPAADAPRDEEM